MDDIMIKDSDQWGNKALKQHLSQNFVMMDFGPLCCLLWN